MANKKYVRLYPQPKTNTELLLMRALLVAAKPHIWDGKGMLHNEVEKYICLDIDRAKWTQGHMRKSHAAALACDHLKDWILDMLGEDQFCTVEDYLLRKGIRYPERLQVQAFRLRWMNSLIRRIGNELARRLVFGGV